jgi:hypothetical protein
VSQKTVLLRFFGENFSKITYIFMQFLKKNFSKKAQKLSFLDHPVTQIFLTCFKIFIKTKIFLILETHGTASIAS